MNATLCLRWCHEVRHHFPNDRRTAIHTLEWLADKAKEDAVREADFEAIEIAIANAKRILELF